jgi:hypothetical protein
MADTVVRLRRTYGQAVRQQVLRERLVARIKMAKPEELFAVLEVIDDWNFHKGVACALLNEVTDEQEELDEIESYLKEWTDEQQLAAFAKHIRDCPADIALPVGKKWRTMIDERLSREIVAAALGLTVVPSGVFIIHLLRSPWTLNRSNVGGSDRAEYDPHWGHPLSKRRPILVLFWHEFLWWTGTIGLILTGSAIMHWLRFV